MDVDTSPRADWPLLEAIADGPPLAERAAAAPVPTVVPRLYFRETFPRPSGTFPQMHAPPALTVERLCDVVLAPRRVLLGKEPAGVLRPSLNRVNVAWHPDFVFMHEQFHARRPQELVPAARWDEPVYWADTCSPDIYGHMLLEALPQLWGYREAGVKTVATSVPRDRTCLMLMEALGVAADDVRTISGAVEAAEVMVATPPVMLRDYVHPEAREMFARLGRLAQRSDAPTPERLYVSRSRTKRRVLVNEAEIEAIFEAAGFVVYHPQEHPIEDQIRTFSKARLIAGSGGSSLHTAVFSTQLEKLLILCSPEWFTLIDLLLHQEEGRLAMLFGTMVPGGSRRGEPAGRGWAIDPHRVRLTEVAVMGV